MGLAQSTDSESEDEDGSLGFTENDDDSEKKSDYVVDEPADDEEPVYEERPTPPYKSLTRKSLPFCGSCSAPRGQASR